MSSSPDSFAEDDGIRESRALDGPERSLASTPLLESVRGDGYRWASLDLPDLDPPTRIPPYPAS